MLSRKDFKDCSALGNEFLILICQINHEGRQWSLDSRKLIATRRNQGFKMFNPRADTRL